MINADDSQHRKLQVDVADCRIGKPQALIDRMLETVNLLPNAHFYLLGVPINELK